MASVDLKDAYCSVPVASLSLKLLKFNWKKGLRKRDTSHQVILITPTRIVPVMLSTQ